AGVDRAPAGGGAEIGRPSPLVGEGGRRRGSDEGCRRGVCRLCSPDDVIGCRGADTPHPSRCASHLLPQGEKGEDHGRRVTLCARFGRGRSSGGSVREPTWMKPAMLSPSSTPNRATAAGS